MDWYYSNTYTRLDEIIEGIKNLVVQYTKESCEECFVLKTEEKQGIYRWKIHSKGYPNWEIVSRTKNGFMTIDIFECLELLYTSDGHIIFGSSCIQKLNKVQDFFDEFNFSPFNFSNIITPN